jgi:hypothetical protein
MKYTIKDLSTGKCAVKNDGTIRQLEEVLKLAFPNDPTPIIPYWEHLFFSASNNNPNSWEYFDDALEFDYPVQSVNNFLDSIYKQRHIVVLNDSLQKTITELNYYANEIGLDVEIIWKPKKR